MTARRRAPGARQRTGRGSGHAIGAVPTVKAIPKPRKTVPMKGVVCPTCSAAVGDECISAAGTPTGIHPTRRRMATRANNLAREAAGTLAPVTTLAAERPNPRLIDATQPPCPGCGLTVALKANGRRRAHTTAGKAGQRGGEAYTLRCVGSGSVP